MNERDETSTADQKDTLDIPPVEALDTGPVVAGTPVTYPVLPPDYTRDLPAEPTAAEPLPAEPAEGRDPAAPVAAAAPDARRPLRVRTVVFGLVMLAISVTSLVGLTTDIRVDGGAVGLGLLIGAGASLVAGGIAAAVREARGGPGAAG